MIAREIVPVPRIATEVRGLFQTPKSLPPKLFYDEAGSALFERITALPEYYLTRTEGTMLNSCAGEIADAAGPVSSLVELGAASSRKTGPLIAALLERSSQLSFFPVDLSVAALRAGQAALTSKFPKMRQDAIVADLSQDMRFLTRLPAPRLVLYLGSSLGNFDPMPATAFLSRLGRALQPGDALLLGTDMRKDPKLLLSAYHDAQGVTAAFNKNILVRINRELGGHFDLSAFRHVVRWNDIESRIEMYLESSVRQSVPIDALGATVEFERGELIHTENSYKYSDAMVMGMLDQAGFVRDRSWTDEHGGFTDHFARVCR